MQIVEGILYVNGAPVEDDTYNLIADAGIAEHEIKLGNGGCLLLGDNCNSSEDSRSGNIGAVARDDIVGKAWFKLSEGSNYGADSIRCGKSARLQGQADRSLA